MHHVSRQHLPVPFLTKKSLIREVRFEFIPGPGANFEPRFTSIREPRSESMLGSQTFRFEAPFTKTGMHFPLAFSLKSPSREA